MGRYHRVDTGGFVRRGNAIRSGRICAEPQAEDIHYPQYQMHFGTRLALLDINDPLAAHPRTFGQSRLIPAKRPATLTDGES